MKGQHTSPLQYHVTSKSTKVNEILIELLFVTKVRESILDHIYTSNPFSINQLTQNWQTYTDHSLISFKINQETVKSEAVWRKYDRQLLVRELALQDWNFKSDSVQDSWNELENQLIQVVDNLAPLAKVVNNSVAEPTPRFIKHKLNKRKRLMKSNKLG